MTAIGSLIGSGKVAEVFAYGEDVLKLYRNPADKAAAFAEAATLALVGRHRLPVPVVRAVRAFGERWGVVMSRAAGGPLATVADGKVTLAPGGLDEMVRLQRLVHGTAEPYLRSLKARLAANTAAAPGLDTALRAKLLADLAALPDGDRLCHGDFHPFNLIGAPGAVTIVDWLDASPGPPAADVCRTYLLILPHAREFAEAYLARTLAQGGLDRAGILAWLSVVAAARLTENAGDEATLMALVQL